MCKKTGSEEFDVPVGLLDKAEIRELVESFILNKLSNVFENKCDGLGVVKHIVGPEL